MKYHLALLLLVISIFRVYSQPSIKKELPSVSLKVEVFPCEKSYYIAEIRFLDYKPVKEAWGKKGQKYLSYAFDKDAIVLPLKDEKTNKKIQHNKPVRMINTEWKAAVLFKEIPEKLIIEADDRKFEVPLSVMVKNKSSPELERFYYKGLAADLGEFSSLTAKDAELIYRKNIYQRRAGLDRDPQIVSSGRTGSGERNITELLELMGGAQAIEGSLQYSTMRIVNTEMKTDEKNIPIDSLVLPELKSHDFAAMNGGKKEDVSDADSYSPHDALVVKFSNMQSLFESIELCKLIQGDLPLFTDAVDLSTDTQKGFFTQLALVKNPEFQKFSGLAIKEASFVFQDPYILEGADYALIFNLRSTSLFDMYLDNCRKYYAISVKNTSVTSYNYKGFNITVFASPDKKIRSYSYFDGDIAVVASSEWMVNRTIDVKKRALKSIADNDDYHYLLRVHDGPGNVFFYIGDDFVSHITSPSLKIAEYRRVNCEANLKIISYAEKLFRLENKSNQMEIPTLVRNGYLSGEPVCPHGGRYSIGADGVPSCSCHGSLNNLNPLSENPVLKVSMSEKKLYDEFVEGYHDYWKKYFDPVGIRMDIDDTIAIHTIILPLISHPQYNDIAKFFGGKPVVFDALNYGNENTVFHAAVKLTAFDNYKSDLSHLPDGNIKELIIREKERFADAYPQFKDDPLAWIGNEIDLFYMDGVNSSENSARKSVVLDGAVLRLEVKDRHLAMKAVPYLAAYFNHGNVVPLEKYGGLVWHFDELCVILVDDCLWAGLNESVIVSFLERKNANGKDSKPLKKIIDVDTAKGNVEVGVYPQNLSMLKRRLFYWTHELYDLKCADIKKRLQTFSEISDPFSSFKTEGAMETESPDLICPLGGKYSWNDGVIVCSMHDQIHNETDSSKLPENPLFSAIEKLRSIVIDLGFTKDGLDTKIYIKNPLRK